MIKTKKIEINEVKEIQAIEKGENEKEIELKITVNSLSIEEAEDLMKSKNVKIIYEGGEENE